MARVIALLAVVFGFLLGGSPASAGELSTDMTVVVYTYDDLTYDAPENHTAPERGPPVEGFANTLFDADDLRSDGASTRTASISTLVLPATYDAFARLAQITRATGTTQTRAQGDDGALSSLARSGVAANGADDGVQLFRHAGPDELADLKATGTFNLGPNSTGKYFADSAEDAAKWGAWLNGGQGGVVSTTVPRSFAEQMMRWEKLDGIGPARFASPEQLGRLNGVMSGVRFR